MAEVRRDLELGSEQYPRNLPRLSSALPSRLVDMPGGSPLLELGGVQEQEWAWGSCPEKGLLLGEAFCTPG